MTARLIALGADVAAPSATVPVGGGWRAWRDLPGVTPLQIRRRR